MSKSYESLWIFGLLRTGPLYLSLLAKQNSSETFSMILDDLKLKFLTDQLHIELSILQDDRLTFELREWHRGF